MALYKYGSYFQESKDTAFDTDHIPGNSAPYAGIFRCMGCGREIGIAGDRFYRHKVIILTRPRKGLLGGG